MNKIIGSTIGLAAFVLVLLFFAPVVFVALKNLPMWIVLFAASAVGVISARAG